MGKNTEKTQEILWKIQCLAKKYGYFCSNPNPEDKASYVNKNTGYDVCDNNNKHILRFHKTNKKALSLIVKALQDIAANTLDGQIRFAIRFNRRDERKYTDTEEMLKHIDYWFQNDGKSPLKAGEKTK